MPLKRNPIKTFVDKDGLLFWSDACHAAEMTGRCAASLPLLCVCVCRRMHSAPHRRAGSCSHTLRFIFVTELTPQIMKRTSAFCTLCCTTESMIEGSNKQIWWFVGGPPIKMEAPELNYDIIFHFWWNFKWCQKTRKCRFVLEVKRLERHAAGRHIHKVHTCGDWPHGSSWCGSDEVLVVATHELYKGCISNIPSHFAQLNIYSAPFVFCWSKLIDK